jgi:hypothetical protein
MLGKIIAVLALTASCVTIGAPPSLAGSKSSPRYPGWYDTNSSASQSRANLSEHVLTPAAVAKVKYLRSVTGPPTVLRPCEQSGVVAPLPAGGYVYAITNGRISKFDAATGSLIWQRTPDQSYTYESLSISGNLLIVGGLDCLSESAPGGIVDAFNATTGATAWVSGAAGGGPIFGAAVVGPYVVTAGISVSDGYVGSILNLSNGKIVWTDEGCLTNNPVFPLVVGQVVIAYGCRSQNNANIVARALATGKRLWSLPGGWAPQSGDLAGSTGSHLYATDPTGTVEDLNPLTGQTEYSLSQAVTVLAVDLSRVYATCGSTGQYVCAYNIGTGALEWQDTNLAASPALAAEADGVLYLDFGTALNAATGTVIKKVWSGQATALAVGDGRIAVNTDSRILDLFGLRGSG